MLYWLPYFFPVFGSSHTVILRHMTRPSDFPSEYTAWHISVIFLILVEFAVESGSINGRVDVVVVSGMIVSVTPIMSVTFAWGIYNSFGADVDVTYRA